MGMSSQLDSFRVEIISKNEPTMSVLLTLFACLLDVSSRGVDRCARAFEHYIKHVNAVHLRVACAC